MSSMQALRDEAVLLIDEMLAQHFGSGLDQATTTRTHELCRLSIARLPSRVPLGGSLPLCPLPQRCRTLYLIVDEA